MLAYSVRPEVRIASLSPNSWGMWQGRSDPRVPLQPIDSTHQAVGHPARLGTRQRRNRADPFPGCAPQWLEKNTLPSHWGSVSSRHIHSLGLFRTPRMGRNPPSRKCHWRRPRSAGSFAGASLQTGRCGCREAVMCRGQTAKGGPFPGSLSQEAPRLRGRTQVPHTQMHVKRKTRQVWISFFKFRVLWSALISTTVCLWSCLLRVLHTELEKGLRLGVPPLDPCSVPQFPLLSNGSKSASGREAPGVILKRNHVL